MPQVRVLSDAVINGVAVKCNQVADVSEEIAAALEAAGHVDGNADAVAYALNENPDVIDCSIVELPAEETVPETPSEEPEPEQPSEEPAPAKPAKTK